MKVLVVSHSCVVDVNQALFAALASMGGTRIELIVPAMWRNEYTGMLHVPRSLLGASFPIHTLPVFMPGHVSLHYYLGGLAAAIRASAADVLFLDEEPWSLVAGQVVAICRRIGMPLLCYTKQNINKRYPIPFWLIEQRTYRSVAAMVAVTAEVEGVLRARGYVGRSAILPHGIDMSIFHPRGEPEMRDRLGLRGVVIGYMGRFVPVKGLDTLLESFATLLATLPASGPHAMLLLVGAGPEEAALRARVDGLRLRSHVVFAGHVPHRDAAVYLRCMDVLVVPSVTLPGAREQFGRVVIEAMACGVPVLGSNSGNIPHLIRQTGGGIVFDEGNVTSLSTKFRELVIDVERRRCLGQVGASAARTSFSLEAITCRLLDILQTALKRGHASRRPSKGPQ
jgi:glycosyltransferase involved in cell wall biosynthesis